MEVLAQEGWSAAVVVATVAGVAGAALGALVASAWARRRQQRAIDAVYQRGWAEQAARQAAHETRMQQVEQQRQAAQDGAAASADALAHLRRELDAARASHRHAEQAMCQQWLALDRQMAAERDAHRREVQALRAQCDGFSERLQAERQTPRIDAQEHQQLCDQREELRLEVAKLLELLEQSDAAQAALQHRANALEQQMVVGQRQLEDTRHALAQERARLERRVYPAHLPPGGVDRRHAPRGAVVRAVA